MQHKVLSQLETIEKPGCVAAAVTILGNKWSPLIIKALTHGPQRFCQLETILGAISPRTLSQRLDDLEQQGIISKQVFAEVPPRVEYTLTEKGLDLLPILKCMADWGNKYGRDC